jgi:uncharacterized protein YjiS (DUF1127 family)
MRTISLGTAMGRRSRTAPQKVRQRALRHSLRQALSRTLALLREWRRRSRDRAELARFDERMLRDIGITRGDVCRELNKPFWRS